MGKDDDRFGWPNNFNQKDEDIQISLKYFKDMALGLIAIGTLIVCLFALIVCIKLVRTFF